MADTGAPWNIPYAEPTNLVRDWPALSEDVAEAVAAGLTDASVVRQVVFATDTTQRSTTSGTYSDAGISVSITPKSADSTLYLFWSGEAEGESSGATRRLGDVQITDSSNNTLTGSERMSTQPSATSALAGGMTIIATTPAANTSARTYKLRFRVRNAGEGGVLRLLNDLSTGLIIAVEVQ